MVKALFDTNILIDYLNGVVAAHDELARYEERSISIVTKMEILASTDDHDEPAIRAWLASFDVVALSDAIADRAVALRRSKKIKLPDAIVWATAQKTSALLVTRNTKDFPADEPGVRAPYKIER